MLETGFDPYQSIVRNIGRDQQENLWRHRAETLRAIETVCESLSVSDRSPDNPTLAELRRRFDACLMGGIDESAFPDLSLPKLAHQIDDAVAQAGREGFILAPGCTLPSFSPRRTLTFLREYADRL